MDIPRLRSDATAEQVAAALAEAGCAVVEQLVPPSTMDRAVEELKPWLDATAFGPDGFSGFQTRRTGGLVARSATCRELVMHPTVTGAVASVLSHATSWQLHLTQVIAIGPEQEAQPVHRDQWAFDFFPFPQGYEVQCNTIWAMTDFVEENGATRVIPGSHRFEDRMELGQAQTVPAEMPKGSVLLYTGSLYHGGGANCSQGVRMGCNITYTLSWLRQEENQYLSVPADIARTLPDDLLRVIGYQRGAYALGYVDDLRDPLEALKGEGHRTRGLGNLESSLARFAGSAER